MWLSPQLTSSGLTQPPGGYAPRLLENLSCLGPRARPTSVCHGNPAWKTCRWPLSQVRRLLGKFLTATGFHADTPAGQCEPSETLAAPSSSWPWAHSGPAPGLSQRSVLCTGLHWLPIGSLGHFLLHAHQPPLSPGSDQTVTVRSGHRWLGDCNQHLLISLLLVTMESHYPSLNDLIIPHHHDAISYEPHGRQGDRTLPHMAFSSGTCLWLHVPFL